MGNVDLDKLPSLDGTHSFLMAVFHSENLSAETAIMTIAYIDRFLTLTGTTFHASNWRRITLSCIIVASKGNTNLITLYSLSLPLFHVYLLK